MKEKKTYLTKASQIKMYIGLHLLFLGYSIGGIFSKRAGMAEFLSKDFIFSYMVVLLILMVYAVFWQQILKKMSLTVAMANKSVTVIWGLVYGWLFFEEKISITNFLGAAIIMIGIYIVVSADKEGICT